MHMEPSKLFPNSNTIVIDKIQQVDVAAEPRGPKSSPQTCRWPSQTCNGDRRISYTVFEGNAGAGEGHTNDETNLSRPRN